MTTGILSPLFAGAPAYHPRSTWGGLSALVVTVLVFAFAAGFGIALAMLLGELSGVRSIAVPNDFDQAVRNRDYGFFLVSQIALQATIVGLALWVSGLYGNRPRDVLALGPARGGAKAYILGFFAVLAVSMALSVLFYLIMPQALTQDLKPFVGMVSSDAAPLLALAVIVGAPLSEELLFRGFLLSALARTRLGFVGASLVSTVLWGLLHVQYSVAGMISVILLGLTFCWLLWRTGSLWVPIVCHAIYNGLVLLVVWAMAEGLLTPGGAGAGSGLAI